VDDVMAELGRAGAIVDLKLLPEDARQPLKDVTLTDYDAVVASGGDGTIRGVLERIDGSGVPLGIIPAGTANVLAAELGIRRRAAQIAAVLLTGRVALMSTGQINGSPFLLMGGVGYDGEVVASVSQSLKPQLGRLAYGWPILRALAVKPRKFTATIDGRVHEMTWLIVSNASRYAGKFVLSRRTGVLTPGLNVVTSRAVSRHQRMAEILALTAGQLERCPTIEMVSARQIEIARSEALAMQIDGDRFDAPSVRFEIGRDQVPILVPEST
jgi:diacylglycerol kinase family enzyme